MKPEDLIKFSVLSRMLAGSRSAITPKRIPKLHKENIDELLKDIQKWIDKNNINKS